MNSELRLKIMDALVHMHAAIKNVQLYAADSPVITNSVERLHLYLLDILREESSFVFAESGKQASICGEFLNQKDQETIHIQFLMDILFNFGLESISFEKGLRKEELHSFINLFARKPEHLRHMGGLSSLMTENKIVHIHIDKKAIQLSTDKNQQKSFVDVKSDPSIKSDAAGFIVAEENHVSAGLDEMTHVLEQLQKMDDSAGPFASKALTESIKKLSRSIIAWIETETAVTPDYIKKMDGIQKLVQEFITHGLFAEANSIIAVFSKINTGVLKKDEKVQSISWKIIQNLASESNINFLFKGINVNEKNKATDAFKILSGFGDDFIIKKLLDIVRYAKDSKERIRIIHIIQEMGQKAIPAIKESIPTDVPWYFLRNMAYIIGRIGNEENADIVEPLLFHKDKRVRMESFKSIAQIGGNRRGSVLLSALSDVDYALKVNIIELLGKIKCVEAVDTFLDMLKSKSPMSKEEQASLQEKICTALGFIGAPEAIPTLSEIAESKSFLGIGSYPVEVKYAAARALTSIKRKQ